MGLIKSSPMVFAKKPVEVEAWSWDGTRRGAREILAWMLINDGVGKLEDNSASQGPDFLVIETLEGSMRAMSGDWIIKGVKGEFYPCKPDVFDETYSFVRTEV